MRQQYDVVVAGGGSGGIAAAVGASRAGARTLLVERGPCLGGAATLRNVVTYCGLYTRDTATQVVFGVADELLAELRGMGAVSEPTRFTAVAVVFDPESVKRAADELCARAGVDVLLHSHVLGATREDDRIASIRLADHSGIHELAATAFVDATGEADIAHHGGCEVRYGNDGWVQNGTLGVRVGGIPADVDITRQAVTAAVRTAKQAGAGDLTAETGLVARMPISGDLITYLADEGYDARDAADTSRAEAGARRQAQAYLRAIRTLPGCHDAYIVSTGPELGTRESRHIVGSYQLTEKEVLGPGPFQDAIAIGAWPMEYHPGPGIPPQWQFIGRPGYYAIPLGVLHSRNTPNLFAAGRTADADRGAGASLRAMGTALATGHAAGIAAALTARHGDTSTAPVRRELLRQGAWLPSR
ncbi:FAD-dependent oxidoreductase [Streptomyces sp. NPDC056519]|uniref:FAD-dependent oxidoreductase n=1 Tax=Streptomyces sp. NPDC056519 TaxID=3345849 RepID=UPI0036D069CA